MVRRLFVVLAGIVATLALLPDAAEAAARPAARTKLECRIIFGPGAVGKVRYEADTRKRQFMATVEVEVRDEDDSNVVGDDDGGEDIPLFAAGDRLAVTIGAGAPPYKAGDIVLTSGGDDGELEGAVKLDAKARGRTVRPFPRDFPVLAVGTQVSIGAGSCVLQDRSRPGPGRR